MWIFASPTPPSHRCLRFPSQGLSSRLYPQRGKPAGGELLGGPLAGLAAGRPPGRQECGAGGRPLKPKTSAEGPRVSASGCSRGPRRAGRAGAAARPGTGLRARGGDRDGGRGGGGAVLACAAPPPLLVKVLVTPSPARGEFPGWKWR